MTKLAEHALNALTPKLEPGEELLSVGHFIRNESFLKTLLLHELWPLLLKYYFMGVTNRRLMIIRHISFSGKSSDAEFYSIPMTDIRVKGTALIVTLPGKEKPVTFGMDFGVKALTGLDIEEFLAALPRS